MNNRLIMRIRALAAGLATLLAVLACSGRVGNGRPDAGEAASASNAPDERLMISAEVDLGRFKGILTRAEAVEDGLVRGNIDLGAGTIRYYSQLPAQDVAGSVPLEKEELEVVDHGPDGELPIEVRKPTIYVMFNLPMVPLAKLGEPMIDNPIFKLVPPIPGTYRWYGTRVLAFEPKAPIVDKPFYTATVSADAKSMGGRRLGKEFRFTIVSETVKLVNYHPGKDPSSALGRFEVPVKDARYAILEFNQPIEPSHLVKFLTATVGGTKAGFSVGRPGYSGDLATRTPRGLLVTLDRDPPENTPIEIRIADGVSPQPGYPPHKGEQKAEYKTVSPFLISGLTGHAYDMPRNNKQGILPVYVLFSHALDRTAAEQPYEVTVKKAKVTPASVEAFGTTLRMGLAGLEPGDQVTVKATAATKDVYGRALSNPALLVQMTVPMPTPYYAFPARGFRQLEAGFPPKVVWEGRNLDGVKLGSANGEYDFRTDIYQNLPGVPLIDVDISSWVRNKVTYNIVDLKPHLNTQGFGTVLFNWATQINELNKYVSRNQGHFAVQVTDIGVTSRFAYNRALVRANSLKTGEPVAGAKVTLIGRGGPTARTGTTDANGLAAIEFSPREFPSLFGTEYGAYYLRIRVQKGPDVCEFPAYDSQNSWTATTLAHGSPATIESPRNRVLLFCDRGLYKPGEEMALRGIHWTQDPRGFTPYRGAYKLTLNDPRSGKLLWSAQGTTSESGGLAQRFRLPEGLEPGTYTIRYSNTAMEARDRIGLGFRIAQFRRLAFQVESVVADRAFTLGDDLSVQVKASYLAGGPMPGGSYTYYWTRKPTPYAPPGPQWKGYVFGPGNWEGEHTLSSGKGNLSASGEAAFRERTGGENAAGAAYRYVLETTVQDIDRQAISSTARILVHPASFYIGARFASGSTDGWWSRFVSTGAGIRLQAVLVDPAGRGVKDATKVLVRLVKGNWKATQQQGVYGRVETRWEYVEEEISRHDLAVRDGTGSLDFQVKDAGDYIVNLEAADASGRSVKTALRFYATGSSWVQRASETPSTIEMVVDKEEYLPGETARILVRTPVPEGSYLMTVEREGIYEQTLLELKGGQTMIEVPVKDEHIPVFYVALSSHTKREGAPSDYFEPDLGRPRGLFGVTGVRVSTRPIELDVEVRPSLDSYKPGSTAEVTIRVTTKDGKPAAQTELTVLAVDRGVLDLIDYHVPDPLDFFYNPANFPLAVNGDDSRRLLLKPVTYDTSSLAGGDGEKLQERKDFQPLALFEPFVLTDKDGVARVSFKLPDSLTTYRVTAVALRGARLGLAEGELLVQNPVNVRAALPRRFRNRDTAAAGVVLQNLTSTPQILTVDAESDILDIAGDRSKKVEIPPHGVYELPFLLCAREAGEGTIRFLIRGEALNEKLTEKVIVERPLVKEAFTTVGSIAREATDASETMLLSERIAPGYGSLTFQASSTMRSYIEPSIQRLLDRDPWCNYYWRLTGSFAAVYEKKGDAETRNILATLKSHQLADGGLYTYSWWPYISDPWISLLTAHLMAFCQDRRWTWDSAPDRERLLGYLETLKKEATDFSPSPYFKAYLAFVLAKNGRRNAAYLKEVESLEDKLGLGGYGLLAQAFLASDDEAGARRIYQRSKNFLLIGTQTVDVKETYEAADPFSSMLSEMALLLKNAVDLREDMGFIQRVAGSLDRSGRRWRTRGDDLWTLLAFIPLLDAEGGAKGDAALTLSAGGSNPAELASFALSLTEPRAARQLGLFEKPIADLPRNTLLPLDLRKKGDTPVYYATILRYALPNETAMARDEGIEVTVRYTTMDGEEVSETDLKLGETYRVKTVVSTPKRRARLELLVPIPSGLEIVDPTFSTTGRHADSGGTGGETIQRETVYGDSVNVQAEGFRTWNAGDWYWYRYYPDSFALDNMMVYRWIDFYAGSRTVDFLVRVTSPGIFPTPPAQASLELEPEVFGRSGGKLFVVSP